MDEDHFARQMRLREARASLGLVVKRSGFGTGARYTWTLPRTR